MLFRRNHWKLSGHSITLLSWYNNPGVTHTLARFAMCAEGFAYIAKSAMYAPPKNDLTRVVIASRILELFRRQSLRQTATRTISAALAWLASRPTGEPARACVRKPSLPIALAPFHGPSHVAGTVRDAGRFSQSSPRYPSWFQGWQSSARIEGSAASRFQDAAEPQPGRLREPKAGFLRVPLKVSAFLSHEPPDHTRLSRVKLPGLSFVNRVRDRP